MGQIQEAKPLDREICLLDKVFQGFADTLFCTLSFA
jgi:hypothetical protein